MQKKFYPIETEVGKLDIKKLINVPTSLNNLETNVDNLDVHNLKNDPIDIKDLSDLVSNELVKNIKFNTLKVKINKSDQKIPGATTLIHINHCNKDKQSLEKNENVDKKGLGVGASVTSTVLYTEIKEVYNKTPDNSDLIKKRDYKSCGNVCYLAHFL